ncbi:MAG TPA: Crp/Fnr family transcriptional regulator [Microvirga sp.]|nr:Crp/Fnr family transcriptional regulator [Microvirga sp.]
MATSSPPSSRPLIAKLESIFTLSSDERTAVENLPVQITTIRADQDVVREGDRPSRCALVIGGLACSYKVTGQGKRQIQAFHIPGDIPDMQSLHLRVLDNSLGTLSPCTVGFIQHETLRALCRSHPRIGDAFWRETLIDAAIFREWTVNVGRREAYARMAHLLCELMMRLRAIGLVEGDTCEIPITQGEFADALGLSAVHVNRVVQQLRADGLVVLTGDTLTVPDWEKLKQAGDFDPTYLHLEDGQAAA